MDEPNKTEEWVAGYCDGLMTARRILITLSRSEVADVADVLAVMLTALRNRGIE